MSRLDWKTILRWGERLLVVGLLAFVAWRIGPQLSAWTGLGARDRPAPELEVETLSGRILGGEEMVGKVVVVNFWATWCPPCRVEMPALQELHEDHADEGLVVLGLSIDAGGTASVERFLEQRDLTFPVAMADRADRRAFGGLQGVPTTVLIGRDGKIRHRVYGLFAPPALKAAVRRLLEEPRPQRLPPGP